MDHDKELVMKAAKLAKLSLTEKEIDVFAPQLKEIIKYVEKLNEVDVSNIEPTSHAISEIKNRFQNVDVDSQHLDISDALKNASQKNGRYFITEAVL